MHWLHYLSQVFELRRPIMINYFLLLLTIVIISFFKSFENQTYHDLSTLAYIYIYLLIIIAYNDVI